jgi:hypothetical protein
MQVKEIEWPGSTGDQRLEFLLESALFGRLGSFPRARVR